jgi:hypothetical protein
MPQPRKIIAYLCRDPPFYVFGGITTWKIDLECYDKGGKKCELAAHCMQDPARCVVLAHGITRFFARQLYYGVSAREGQSEAGDMAFRLLRAAIKQGQMVADEAARDPEIPRRLR